jgi:DNA-binding response OmpR family regulator
MILESLLVSKDAALLGVLRPTLEKLAVNVEVCSGSQTGTEMLRKRKFDAVIVDCDDMPGGVDLLESLRQTQSNGTSVTFAVLNGNASTQRAFQIGANFVLQKPLTPLNATRCFNAALNFMVRERRRYFRHPVEMSILITLPGDRKLEALSTNLSEGGIALHVSGRLPKEEVATLRFTLPDSNAPIELRGNTAWADGSGNAGIRFIEVPPSTQSQLERWLCDRMHEELPVQLQAHLKA